MEYCWSVFCGCSRICCLFSDTCDTAEACYIRKQVYAYDLYDLFYVFSTGYIRKKITFIYIEEKHETGIRKE